MNTIKYYISTAIHHPKKVIWKLDKIFLRGRIKAWRNAKREQKRLELERFRLEHPEEWYTQCSEAIRHCYPVIGNQVYSTRDIFMAQFVGGVFKGYDIVVRILAIEQYYGENVIGYDMYRRLQSLTNFDWIPRFSKLIASYEDGGDDVMYICGGFLSLYCMGKGGI